MAKQLIIIGGGKGADLVIRYFEDLMAEEKSLCGSPITISGIKGILDDCDIGKWARMVKRIGKINDINLYHPSMSGIVLCISISTNLPVRRNLFNEYKEYEFVNVLRSDMSRCDSIGQSNIVFPDSHFDWYSQVGNNNIISAGCIIAHHNRIGSGNLLGPGCMFSGSVTVGDNCVIGSGVIVERAITIGSNVNIASGTVITGDLSDGSFIKAYVNGKSLQVQQGGRILRRSLISRK